RPRDVGKIFRAPQDAALADERRLAGEGELIGLGGDTTEGAPPCRSAAVSRDRLCGDQQRVTKLADVLLCGFKSLAGNSSRIRAANHLTVLMCLRSQLHGFCSRLAEDRAQKLGDEIRRGLIVVVNNELEVLGLASKIGHGENLVLLP